MPSSDLVVACTSRSDQSRMKPVSRKGVALQNESRAGSINELLTIAVCTADVGVWEIDEPNNYFYAHPVLLDMLGICDHQYPMCLEEWISHVHPQDRHQSRNDLQRLVRGESSRYQGIRRMIHSDGSIRRFLCRASALEVAEGKRLIVGVEIDVPDSVG